MRLQAEMSLFVIVYKGTDRSLGYNLNLHDNVYESNESPGATS